MSCQPRGSSDQRKQESRMSAQIIHVELTDELALSGSISCMTHSPAQKVRAGNQGGQDAVCMALAAFLPEGGLCQDVSLNGSSQRKGRYELASFCTFNS